jgi:hypothetical protein
VKQTRQRNRPSLLSTTPLLALLLVGCGGGGGSSATLSPFSSWSAIQRGTSVSIGGLSQSGTYVADLGADRITSRTLAASSEGATYTATYDTSGNVTAVSLTPAGGSTTSWSRAAGDTFGVLIINNSIDAVISADGSAYALAANPFDYGWDYQSFGAWTTGAGTGSGTFGAMSVGSFTPGASIPTSGTATYTGFSGGRYINSSGQYYFTSSTMSAATNFSTRSVTFTTSSTQMTPDLLTNVTNNNNLNLSGTLTYSAASNQITGNVATAGGLIGTVNSRFFGPAAEEFGGTFAVDSGGGLEGYSGAFGGRR